jgi:thiamine-phosphate pyrophosphorylase
MMEYPVLGRLHFIADHRAGQDPESLFTILEAVLGLGPATGNGGTGLLVQLRVKECPDRVFFDLATRAARACRDAGVPMIVNDRVDIALAVGAGGVHVGEDDLPVAEARRLVGRGAIVGASVSGVEVARAAVLAGATYLGAGPCYPTSTKVGMPAPMGPDGVAAIAREVDVPVIAIGGITVGHVPELLEAGAHGVAVISAIAGAPVPVQAARDFLGVLAGTREAHR